MTGKFIQIKDKNKLQEFRNLTTVMEKEGLNEGDVIVSELRGKERYGLVIKTDYPKREITVVSQLPSGHVRIENQRTNKGNYEMERLEQYNPGTEKYNEWKKKFEELEIWRTKWI